MRPPLLERIALSLRVQPSEIRKKNNGHEYCRRRGAIAQALQDETDMSLSQIGNLLGGFNHSTIFNAIKNSRASTCPLNKEIIERTRHAI